MMRLSILLTVCFLVGCSDAAVDDSSVLESPAPTNVKDRDAAGKGDVAQNTSTDNDSDGVQLTDEFCAWISEESDGYCLEECRSFDPDCEGVAPPAQDICRVEDRYNDGVCDDDCDNPDPDCEPPADVCDEELLYGDGTCDEVCDFPDPDCKPEYEDTGELTEGERRVCGRFTGVDDEIVHELASSLCIERVGQAHVDCIEACLEEFFSD